MTAYISLGSNIGDRELYIKKALSLMGPCVKNVSPLMETRPEEMRSAGMFLNAVAEIDTSLSPYGLLDFLEDIEIKLGRDNKGRYMPRTIDLDILYYGDAEIDTDRLKIPHPALGKREFLWKLLKALEKGKIRGR